MALMMKLGNRLPEEWLFRPLGSLPTMMVGEMMKIAAAEATTTIVSGRMLVLDGVWFCFSSPASSDTFFRYLPT